MEGARSAGDAACDSSSQSWQRSASDTSSHSTVGAARDASNSLGSLERELPVSVEVFVGYTAEREANALEEVQAIAETGAESESQLSKWALHWLSPPKRRHCSTHTITTLSG